MNRWIQKAVKRPGRVRRYVMRMFGEKAFDRNGKIKLEYLKKAERLAEKNNNKSLAAAIRLAIRFRKMKK